MGDFGHFLHEFPEWSAALTFCLFALVCFVDEGVPPVRALDYGTRDFTANLN